MWFLWKTLSAALGGRQINWEHMEDRWKSPVSGEPPVWHTLGHGLVTAQQSLGFGDTRLQVLSCQEPRRPRLGRGCSLLLCSTRPPETDPSPPSHHQWVHPVASAAGQSVKGPSGKPRRRPEAARPTSTSDRKPHVRFYKRHDGQTQACGWDPKARGWKARPRGIRRRNLLTKRLFGRFGVFRWM